MKSLLLVLLMLQPPKDPKNPLFKTYAFNPLTETRPLAKVSVEWNAPNAARCWIKTGLVLKDKFLDSSPVNNYRKSKDKWETRLPATKGSTFILEVFCVSHDVKENIESIAFSWRVK